MKKFVVISLLILLLLIPFSGCTEEKQEYSKHEVDRFISIAGPGYPITYSIKVPKVINNLELKTKGGTKVVQQVEYEVVADSNVVVVNSEKEVADQSGEDCVIIKDSPNYVYIHGYNLSNQKHNFKIRYVIRSYRLNWGLDSSDVGDINDIPEEINNKYCISQWRVGDLNGDGEMDKLDEDENKNANLDLGEDKDGDGYLDVNEDLDGNDEWDWRIDPLADSIVEKANELKGDKTNIYDIIKSFYDYLRNNYRYPNMDEMAFDYYMYSCLPKSALRTMMDGYGDCDDISILFVSLCRALGIPAWLECGATFDPSLKQWQPNSWANVWLPLESGRSVVVCVDPVNQLFIHRDRNRITEFIDDSGDSIELEEYFTSYTYSHSSTGSQTAKPDYTDTYTYVSYKRGD